jgi:hypothetical protein
MRLVQLIRTCVSVKKALSISQDGYVVIDTQTLRQQMLSEETVNALKRYIQTFNEIRAAVHPLPAGQYSTSQYIN